MSDKKPLIIIIDIDGTIIGDIRPQVLLYEINYAIKKIDKKFNILNNKDFDNKLEKGIIRPYFAKCLKKLKEQNDNIEYFIYTASDKKWATFLVPHIEKIIDIKINRPIFTREHCDSINNSLQKSLTKVTPSIIKTLKKKYKSLNKNNIENHILIIENAHVYESKDISKIIICPTYDYKYPENIPAIITENIFNKYSQIIIKNINKYISLPSINDYIEFQRLYYTYYIQYISSSSKSNNIQLNDKFFLYLSNIIIYKHISIFTPNNIKYISNKINSKINKINVID